jgi:hypothetical protein
MKNTGVVIISIMKTISPTAECWDFLATIVTEYGRETLRMCHCPHPSTLPGAKQGLRHTDIGLRWPVQRGWDRRKHEARIN